tara:strand:- start:255 stop:776 length:522 start_codon:yes stop_codon:yes gene_type:complete
MASALAQMTRAKALSEAHYHVGSSVTSAVKGRDRLGPIEKTGQDTLNFLHQTTPITSHLAVILQYQSVNFRNTTAFIDIELRDTASNSYTGTVLDVGVRLSEIELEGLVQRLLTATTGAQLIDAPSNPTPDAPRPLYVPSANRGDLLNVVITTDQVKLHTVHIYDLFIPEETP